MMGAETETANETSKYGPVLSTDTRSGGLPFLHGCYSTEDRSVFERFQLRSLQRSVRYEYECEEKPIQERGRAPGEVACIKPGINVSTHNCACAHEVDLSANIVFLSS